MEQLVKELENASQILLAPPNLVSAEQRHTAENVFLNFQRSSMPYGLCRHILESCKNDYVLFQAASTIKQSVVREWSLLKAEDIESLRTFLLQYATQNIGLQNYVREQVLQAVAVMFKRGTIDSKTSNRDVLFSDVTQLISSGNLSMQMVACSILTALLNEYSSTNKSSSVGLTWEFHSRCKMAFEVNDLKKVFLFCLQVLQELEKMPNPMNREATTVFNRFLSIMEQMLCWDFMPRNIPKKLIGTFVQNQNVSFKPPATWKDLLLDKGLLELMFRIHVKVRHNSEMAHHSLQCLAQLATMNGQIFFDDKTKTEYLGHYIITFLNIFMSSPPQDYEALGLANIVNYLLMYFPVAVFLLLPDNLMERFLQSMTKLACNFCQAASQEEAMQKDDTLYMEAFEKTLDAYTCFINSATDLPKGSLDPHAIEIFNTYLQCHLSPPDGSRSSASPEGADEDEYEEDEEEDRVKFKDQLLCVGTFGRHVPHHSVPILTRLLEDRINRLNGQLQRIQQHQNHALSPGGPTQSPVDIGMMTALSEDLHWLLMISANLLTDFAEGETPMIPSPIMDYSISLAQKTDIQTTLKILASPGESVSTIPGADTNSDTVVRLISAVFRLCEVERKAITGNMAQYLSPQVGCSAMYFLCRWVMSYLLPEESYYSQMSLSLNTAFGRDTEGGQWTVSFLVEKICLNLSVWTSEEALTADTLELLVSLVEKPERCNAVAKCNSLWGLAKDYASGRSSLEALPGKCKRELCKALVLAASSPFDDKQKQEEYFQLDMQTHKTETGSFNISLLSHGAPQLDPSQVNIEAHPGVALCMEVLNSQHGRFKALLSVQNLKKQFHEQSVQKEVLSLLDSMCGVAEATRVDNVSMLFGFLHPALVESVNLLDLFHSYEEVVHIVLELFSTVANRQICYLNSGDTQRMYEVSLSMVQMFAKHNTGKRQISKDAEDDQFADLLILMEMLTNLLSKDFIDFGSSDDETNGATTISAADIVLFGLNTLVPLMTVDLLKFPALCTSYMRLLAYITEIYPEKVCQLPDDLFKAMMGSMELGLNSFGTDITKLSMDYLTSMATYVHNHNMFGSAPHQALARFLQSLFNMLFLETFDMDLMDTVSVTFFSLICCHKDYYKQLVTELLSKPRDENQQKRLVEAFEKLSQDGGLQFHLDRPNRLKFMHNFDRFLVDVRGFLCVK